MSIKKHLINMENIIYNRNFLFFSKEDQKIIKNKRILLTGCGLGSQIAVLLLRTGFTNITIADGDKVSVSNLNRQHFFYNDVNKFKANSLKKYLLKINKLAKINIINKFLKKDDLNYLIKNHDYIINTIDFDSNAFLDCSEICKKYNKIEIFPTNLGFGGSVVVFNGDSFKSFFNEKNKLKLKKKILDFLIKENGSKLLKEKYKEYLLKKFKKDPQNGISTYITSAMVVFILYKLSKKEEVKLFPKVYYLDPSFEFEK